MRASKILSVLHLVACSGGSDKKDPILIPDSGTVDVLPDSDSQPPNVVSVDTFGEMPAFIRYRNGSGPWLEPTASGSGYEFRIDDRYELVAVCGDATVGYDVGFEAATYEEFGGETFLPCFGTGTPTTTTTHAVTGTMVQAGKVMVGNANDDSTTPNWSFALDVEDGVQDVLAIGSGRMRLQRAVLIDKPTALPAIDVVQSGVALDTRTLTINNMATGDTARTRTYFLTQRAFFVIEDAAGQTARVAPAAQVIANDVQFVEFSASNGTYRRTALKRHTAAAPVSTFTLLPRLENTQLANGTATWTSIPDGGRELLIYSGETAIHRFASPGFLGTATSLAIDTEIPGFMPEWKVGSVDYASFEVNTSAGGVSLRSSIEQTTEIPPLHALSRREHVRVEAMRQR